MAAAKSRAYLWKMLLISRFKNLEIGYTLPAIHNSGIKNIRVYVSCQNIFTITKYTGLDPESTDLLDKGTYPAITGILIWYQC